MIRKALEGKEVTPSIALRVLLYTYCKIFSISPNDAKHTPMKDILEMISIHTTVEEMKAKAMEKEQKKMGR